MSESDFALAVFRWFIPAASLLISIIALYNVTRSPLLERMRVENQEAKALARVQEMEGDFKALTKGVDATCGALEIKIQGVADRITAAQKRDSAYAQRMNAPSVAEQQLAAMRAAHEQGMDISAMMGAPAQQQQPMQQEAPAAAPTLDRAALSERLRKQAYNGSLGTAPFPDIPGGV